MDSIGIYSTCSALFDFIGEKYTITIHDIYVYVTCQCAISDAVSGSWC